MNWNTIALMAQTLMYTAGAVAFVLVVLLGYASNERRKQSHDLMMKEHAAMMRLNNETLRAMEKH
jgi:hypothetical protein